MQFHFDAPSAGRLRPLIATFLCVLWLPPLLEPALAPELEHTHGGQLHRHARGLTPHEHIAHDTTPPKGQRSLYQIALAHAEEHHHGGEDGAPGKHETPDKPDLLWTTFVAFAALDTPPATDLPMLPSTVTPYSVGTSLPIARVAIAYGIRGPPAAQVRQPT